MSKKQQETKPVNKFKQLEMFMEQAANAMSATHEDETHLTEHTPEYITPSIEVKLSKEKRQVCRDILLEIRNFGVSQRQLLFLIHLLALDLEDVSTMKAISSIVSENRENIPLTKEDVSIKTLTKPKGKKLILK